MVIFFPVSKFVQEVQKILRDEGPGGAIYDVDTEILPELNNGCAATIAADPQALVFNVPYQVVPCLISVNDGGSGYADGDEIVLAGGTFSTPITLAVAGQQNGMIDMVEVVSYGSYTAYPGTATQGSTTGSGTGATFTILKAGPRQELTPDGASLIDVRMNLGTDGQTLSNIITKVPKDSMDADLPTWPGDVCGVNGKPATVQHYMTDPDDPKRFYLWPYPNVMQTPWFLQIIYRSVPNDVGLTDNFPLPSLYWPAVKAYIIWHVLERKDEFLGDPNVQTLIASKKDEFNRALGLTAAGTSKTIPRDTVNKQ